MAPPLAESQHAQIRAMTLRKRPPAKIADAATCSERGVYRIQKKLRCFDSTKAPSNSVGRPRSITPEVLDALYEHLIDNPELYQHEIVD
jgi:hypothetical protein